MTIAEVLKQYRSEVSDSNKYISEAFRLDKNGAYILDKSHRSFIVDAAILKFYKAWETYLESIFKCFLLGECTLKGTNIKTFAKARNEKHATKLLVGINKYFDWSNPEYVKQLSCLFLEESNIIESTINSISIELGDLRTIRNASAHLTATARKPLESLYQRKTGKQMNGVTPYDIILLTEPNSKITYWDFYQRTLDVAAENIANGET